MKRFICILLSLIDLNAAAVKAKCQFKLAKESGIIKSPGYPQPYSNGLNCSWQIVVPFGRRIILEALTFELERSYNCEMDALYIYDGPNERSKLYSKPYCENNMPKRVTSSGNLLYLRFVTDNMNNAKGFFMKYHSTKVCDYHFNQTNGTFASPNFPLNYYAKANCSYWITTEKNMAILLRFHDFALENRVRGECYDYINIYDVLDTGPKLLKQLCGVGIPLPIQSSSNQILVKFHSDDMINNQGFNATFYSILHVCERNQFKCGNGRCIHVNLLCNSVNDCLDNTDEVFCSCDRFKCENLRCVSEALVCDGKNNCGDWSDEKNCGENKNSLMEIAYSTVRPMTKKSFVKITSTTERPKCGYAQFECHNKKCLPPYQRCNGQDNCGDNSDEKICTGKCKHMNGGCVHTCNYDKKLGVRCGCYKGFQLDSDGISCIDIDECSSNPCGYNASCSNTIGSYKCGCPKGYHLTIDQLSCTDFNECLVDNGHCEQRCVNNIGSFECTCFIGYLYNKYKKQCLDVDECKINNGGCAEKCVNYMGKFRCECHKSGYTMIPGNTTCVEIDECQMGTARCDQHCINTDGSYRCECRIGFRLDYDQRTCRDINECLEGVPQCYGNCENTLGSYFCKCDPGFKAFNSNTMCEDINECEQKNGGCSNACENTFGSFQCKCYAGYVARDPRSFTCVDKNECDENPCDSICVNTPGSFNCSCEKGYYLVNRTRCIDINECDNLDTSGCRYRCTNTPGSYFCTCPDGSMLHTDKMTCIKRANDTGCPRVMVDKSNIVETKWANVTKGWTWQTSLSIDFQVLNVPIFKCMGILVDKEFVLTSGHCVKFGPGINIDPERLLVSVGGYNSGYLNSKMNIRAKSMTFHKTLDLVLIHLSTSVLESQGIQPICLPRSEHDINTSYNEQLLAVTWLSNDIIGNNLQQIYTKIDDSSSCEWEEKRIFGSENSICANFRLNKPFLPMSGSALLGMLRGSLSKQKKEKWYLTGILIYGSAHPTNITSYATTYKRVGYHKSSAFAQWIRDTILVLRSL